MSPHDVRYIPSHSTTPRTRGTDTSMTIRTPAEHENLVATLRHLPFSGVPIRHLSVYIEDLCNKTLSEIAPLHTTLESLVIVFYHDPFARQLECETLSGSPKRCAEWRSRRTWSGYARGRNGS
ncbi:hypothetical protein C2E23DRAFT_804012 [Lenzites betulinus]|nr:hypothetical protein C2E23DRAFT_804012 [Lenzites betulinus]